MNRHHGRYGCVLSPDHPLVGTFCVDSIGNRKLDDTAAFRTDKAAKFRAEVVGAIRASLATEFDAFERAMLTSIVEVAARKDPYILRHVWDQTYKMLRDQVDAEKPLFLTTCLQYHGLDVTR